MPVSWQVYPRSARPHPAALAVVNAFDSAFDSVNSKGHELNSNQVLGHIEPALTLAGFEVEKSKLRNDKISIPVLFGRNGTIEKSFDADAFHPIDGVVLEVEAGRAVDNNQFLKDLFQACMMQDAHHLVICARLLYRKNDDFDKICRFMETLYASNRLHLPLKTVMVLGY